jgi:hypothetical protein
MRSIARLLIGQCDRDAQQVDRQCRRGESGRLYANTAALRDAIDRWSMAIAAEGGG